MRKSRGIRLSDECMARLLRLRRATGRGAHEFIEPLVMDLYDRHRRHPILGPVLKALEEADEALARAPGRREVDHTGQG